jgi:glycerophosphoryl diester phosphodiesterase
MPTRRSFLSAVLASLPAPSATAYRLIAHRGGVVDESHPENSPGSIRAAIEQGYWMLEVDIRRTADGEPILQHDATFRRYYGVEKAASELAWKETRSLRSKPGNTSPMHFRDVCRMCRGKTRLMLDIKGEDWPDEFYRGLATVMEEHALLENAYVLGSEKVKRFFRGRCRLSANRATLREAIRRGEDVSEGYFLFELGSVLNEEALALCRDQGVAPVAAINTFRYTQARRDEWKGAEEDVARLKRLGVQDYQIDSRYRSLFV